MTRPKTYWQLIWARLKQHPLGMGALSLLFLFFLAAIYAPFLASSKPLVVQFEGSWYFPLFRYLFYSGFFTKPIDLFYNIMIFTFPLFVWSSIQKRFGCFALTALLQIALFLYLIQKEPHNPGAEPPPSRSWEATVAQLKPYARLNLLLQYQQQEMQHQKLLSYEKPYLKKMREMGLPNQHLPTLWQQNKRLFDEEIADSHPEDEINYAKEKRAWLQEKSLQLRFEWMPLLRPFHWEEDVGGDPLLNQVLPWWEQSRMSAKDLSAALIFGIRTSFAVGFLAILLALSIGIPIGAAAGYYGGRMDLFTCRFIEIWESMPVLFMLLMSVSFIASKSIFLMIGIIGLFGWTEFSRYTRGEFLKQKSLPYVEACHSLGFGDARIMFSHLLPNALPPILTLIPFAMMAAITTEAALAFLGLGEEGSASWGVLMDEGRSRFPAESALLWPPATCLTLLLISIAILGDALRDALDPKSELI